MEDTPEIVNSSGSAGTAEQELNQTPSTPDFPKLPHTWALSSGQAGAQGDNTCPSTLSREQENQQKPLGGNSSLSRLQAQVHIVQGTSALARAAARASGS